MKIEDTYGDILSVGHVKDVFGGTGRCYLQIYPGPTRVEEGEIDNVSLTMDDVRQLRDHLTSILEET